MKIDTIFYSWQSDSPNSINRGFIEKALENAANSIRQDGSIKVEPVVDRDTSGIPGSPDIAATILRKIDQAEVFVCDVTIISKPSAPRPSPNPNVLIELGYAIKSLGAEKIVMVMNTEFGGPELLPFDLRMKRVLTYQMIKDIKEKSPERKKLESILGSNLRIIFNKLQKQRQEEMSSVEKITDKTITSIQKNDPDKIINVRKFFKYIQSKIDQISPDLTGEGDKDDLLIESIDKSENLIVEFSKICEMATIMKSHDVALTIYKSFDYFLNRYRTPRGFHGSYRETDFDFFKFLGHEMFVSYIALLIRENQWDLLADIIETDIYIENTYQGGSGLVSFNHISESVGLLYYRNQRLNLNSASVHADILNERHTNRNLAEHIPFEQFVEADYFLFLRSELTKNAQDDGASWLPWSTLYLETVPRYLAEAKRKAFAQQLLKPLGTNSIAELKTRIQECALNFTDLFRYAIVRPNPFRTYDFDEIGSR